MTQQQLDDRDLAALRKLDAEFEVGNDGTTARLVSELEIQITRVGDQIWLRFGFPGHELLVKILRVQLLQELGVDESERLKNGD